MPNENFDDLFVTEKEHEQRKTFHPYSKDDWLAKKKQERADAFQMLEEATEKVAEDPQAFLDYMETQAWFDRYSVSNCLLISAQNPNAMKLADYDTWKDQGIFVSKGESGIVILEPGNEFQREDGSTGVSMNVKKLFDISQTSAAENGVDTKTYQIRPLLKALMAESPVDLKISDNLPAMCNGTYKPDEKAIYLRQGMDGPDIFRTMAYEIILVKMEERGEDSAYIANCATFMLCERFSVNAGSFDFRNSAEYFAGKTPKEIRASLEKMRSYANELSQPMTRMLEKVEKSRSDEVR